MNSLYETLTAMKQDAIDQDRPDKADGIEEVIAYLFPKDPQGEDI